MAGTYEGWKNHATWLVSLHIDNTEELYTKWRDAARLNRKAAPGREQVTSGIWTTQEAERFTLADRLKDSMDRRAGRVKDPLLNDLVRSALSDVDWHEIADHLLEDIGETDSVTS